MRGCHAKCCKGNLYELPVGLKDLKVLNIYLASRQKTLQISLSSIRFRCCCLSQNDTFLSPTNPPGPGSVREKGQVAPSIKINTPDAPSIHSQIHSFSLVCDGPLILLGGSSCAACWLVGFGCCLMIWDGMGNEDKRQIPSSSLFSIYSSY
jgi:hypothetical protein